MWLAPDKPDHDERTFECAECNHSVTERWRDFIPNICPAYSQILVIGLRRKPMLW